MNGIFYFKHRAVRSGNLTEVTLLTTHGSVERGFLGDNCTSLTVSQCLYNLILGRQNGNLGFRCQTINSVVIAGSMDWYTVTSAPI